MVRTRKDRLDRDLNVLKGYLSSLVMPYVVKMIKKKENAVVQQYIRTVYAPIPYYGRNDTCQEAIASFFR